MATITDYDHDDNPYVTCPYFPEHTLPRSRLPYHLIKCQSHPRAPKLLACPFNYLHRVRPEEKRQHLEICEDRQALASYARPAEKPKKREATSTVANNIVDKIISEET